MSICRSYRRRHAPPMFRLRRNSDAAATPTLGETFQIGDVYPAYRRILRPELVGGFRRQTYDAVDAEAVR